MADDDRYVSEDIIWKCWRKADILSETWDADTNNYVESAFLPERVKQVCAEVCDELCALMKEVKFKLYTTGVDTIGSENVFENSFVNDSGLSYEDYQELSNAWINIEDEKLVIDAIVDEELDGLDATSMDIDDENNGAYKEEDDERENQEAPESQ